MADDALSSDELVLRSASVPDVASSDELARGAQSQSYLAGLARSLLGQGALMGWGDEVTAKLRSIANGESYDKALADERSKVKQFRKENPKTALAAEIGGGFLTPGLGLVSGIMKPAATTLGRMAQGGVIGSGVGAVAGSGATEGDRLEGAKSGAAFGAMIGPAAPVVGSLVGGAVNKVADVAGPTMARLGARVSGDSPSARAADFIMKRDLQAAGETPAALRQRFADADRARTFHGGVGAQNASAAESPLMLADVSHSLQKLAGSAARASPEAGARAEAVIGARQTGTPPPNARAQSFVDEAGLTTRNPLAPKPGNVEKYNPAGQHERIGGGLRRVYTLADEDFHGISANAYRTEQDLLAALKEKSKQLFPEAYKEAKPFDLSEAFKGLNQAAEDRAGSHLATLQRAAKLFIDPKTGVPLSEAGHLKRAQSAKEMLDDTIETAMRAGKNKLASDLIEFRKAATEAMRATNPKYGEALDFYSGEMRRKEAIQWGRDALRADSNATADQFAAFPKDMQKLARQGIIEAIENAGADKKRAADLTQLFETNRVQSLLRETIPRSKGNGPYAQRPEMFGDYIANEKAMIGTRDKVLGNSATAGRLADDERLTRQTLSQMFDRFKQGNLGVVPMALEVASVGLTKIFGFREDVAQELGRRLFTAKPAERERILARLEAKWGSDKIGAFTRFLDQSSTAGAVALPATGARAIGESKR